MRGPAPRFTCSSPFHTPPALPLPRPLVQQQPPSTNFPQLSTVCQSPSHHPVRGEVCLLHSLSTCQAIFLIIPHAATSLHVQQQACASANSRTWRYVFPQQVPLVWNYTHVLLTGTLHTELKLTGCTNANTPQYWRDDVIISDRCMVHTKASFPRLWICASVSGSV